MADTPLWSPSDASVRQSRLFAFMSGLNERFGVMLQTYRDVHTFSVDRMEEFWDSAWNFMDVLGDKGEGPYVRQGDRFETASFFPDARLNFAENLLKHADNGLAMIFRGEDKVRTTVSWAELRRDVAKLQAALIAAGVGSGDRVAALMPNMPEAVIGMLATASIGAIWSSASPDFGVQGVLDRFGQIEPKVLIVCDGYYYNGKAIPIAGKISALIEAMPSVRRVIIVPYLRIETGFDMLSGRVTAWDEALRSQDAVEPVFERFPFDHPLYILYSSGTTGVPKCIVHRAGGILLQHLKEQQLQGDLMPGDRLFYFTTCGWMMWNWLVSGLASGVTLVLYDGSPFYPDANAMFDYADEARITLFGTSPKFIEHVKKAGLRPRDTHDLSSIKRIASTGSPLAAESFDFVYEAITPDVHLASISGGTDLCASFVTANPFDPVYRGEIQGPALGMAVDVFDEAGRSLSHGKGELVCTKPFPSIPLGFWNDASGDKFRHAYFDRFPGVWHHGDYAEWTDHGGMIIHGRSDATLNPGGVRIGTAEIYRQVEQLDEIMESIVIGQDRDGDVRVVLFVVLRGGLILDDDLRDTIRRRIRTGASPRHVPALILQVPEIPRTKSGKITEIAVRDIVHGREVKNKEALANPDALGYYAAFTELRS